MVTKETYLTEERKAKLYFKEKNIVIYNDDILHTDIITNKSIDLIVTSPPWKRNILG